MNKSILVAAGLAALAALPLTADVAVAKLPDVQEIQPVDMGEFQMAELVNVGEYQVGRHDSLRVYIPGVTDFNISVGPDGNAMVPYVGLVQLRGLTLPEASSLLEGKLSAYFKTNGFSLGVASYASRKIYVTGCVASPGIIELSYENLNAFAAVQAAGGPKEKARTKHIHVIRKMGNMLYHKEINIDAYVKKLDMTQNVALEDGDIVYVPESNKILWSEIVPYFNTWTVYKTVTND